MHSHSFVSFFCCITVWIVLWLTPCMLLGSEKRGGDQLNNIRKTLMVLSTHWDSIMSRLWLCWSDWTECPCNAIFSLFFIIHVVPYCFHVN